MEFENLEMGHLCRGDSRNIAGLGRDVLILKHVPFVNSSVKTEVFWGNMKAMGGKHTC